MQICKNLIAVLTVMTVLGFGSARAQVILYNNGTPATGVDGYADFADTNNVVAGSVHPADDGTYTMYGTVFTSGVTATAYRINFGGLYSLNNTPTTDNFTVDLYSINPITGAPDAILETSTLSHETRNIVGLSESGTRDIYAISALFNTPLTLVTGTTYYLGINDTSSAFSNFATAETILPGASNESYTLHNGVFQSAPYGMAFQLVPEPSAWVLMMLGGLGLFVARKWRTKFLAR